MGLFSKKTLDIGDIIEALASMSDEDKAQILSALTPPAAEEAAKEAEATEEASEEAAETVEAVEEVAKAEEAEAKAKEKETDEEAAEEAAATEEDEEKEKIDLAGIDAKIKALDEVIKSLTARIENIEKGPAEEEKVEELFGLEMAEGIAAAENNEEEKLRKEVFGF